MFNRETFLEVVRSDPFGGSLIQDQVDGMNYILDTWEDAPPTDDLRWLAYALATTYHETGNNRHVHQYVDEWIDVAEAAREDIIDFNYDRQRRAGQDTPVGKADRNRIRFSSLQSTMFENARGLHMRRAAPGATATVCRFGVDAHQLCHFGVVVAQGLFKPARLNGCHISKVSAAQHLTLAFGARREPCLCSFSKSLTVAPSQGEFTVAAHRVRQGRLL